MSTRFLLIRHASVDPIGTMIAGRGLGVHLNAKGRMQAEQIAGRLRNTQLEAIYSSPMERTLETAEPLARAKQLKVLVREEFTELDFGDWTGKTFTELETVPEWRHFNQCRSLACIPGGESMLQVAQRMADGVDFVRRQHPDATVAVFSHCDPLRALLVQVVGMSLDSMLRLTIAPASISTVEVDSCGWRILGLNQVCEQFQVAEG